MRLERAAGFVVGPVPLRNGGGALWRRGLGTRTDALNREQQLRSSAETRVNNFRASGGFHGGFHGRRR